MPLDYNEAKTVYAQKLCAEGAEGYARIDAAMLAMCEFVYRRGLEDGQKMAQDAEVRCDVFSRA